MKTTTGNRRLDDMIWKAVDMGIGGGRYWLDCYMSRTVREDIAPTIHTRINAANNDFIMEVYEESSSSESDA